MKTKIFVYGTLMSKMANNKYLQNSKYLGIQEIEGFIMYDLGYFPGIVKGTGKVKGETYEIDNALLEELDKLEDEGNLYLRKKIQTYFGETQIYIYNKTVDNKNIIPYEMQPYNNLVYYVSYGSNLLEERFLTYIKGGICKYNNKHYNGCNNKHLPIKNKAIKIPYEMYFSMQSSSWGGKAVSFINYNKNGYCYARAYLITEEQFEDIHRQEGKSWYDKIIKLESIDGIPTYTFTNSQILPSKSLENVDNRYKKVLHDGLKETFPKLSDNDINNYLEECGNRLW